MTNRARWPCVRSQIGIRHVGPTTSEGEDIMAQIYDNGQALIREDAVTDLGVVTLETNDAGDIILSVVSPDDDAAQCTLTRTQAGALQDALWHLSL